MTRQSERIAAEQKWYALTGRVIDLGVEAGGEIHLALQDATGDKSGIVVAEVPAKTQWCEIRKRIFSWTRTRFPSQIRSKVDEALVMIVIGKAFWDVSDAPEDQSNWRKNLPGYAVWEIHPVMKMELK